MAPDDTSLFYMVHDVAKWTTELNNDLKKNRGGLFSKTRKLVRIVILTEAPLL